MNSPFARLEYANATRCITLLLFLTIAAYIPVLRHGGFIWDDDAYIVNNILLSSDSGLRDIWSRIGPQKGGTPQYYPLVFTVFRAEYHLWKLAPFGYHLTNILLHALNAILVWQILRRLSAPGALLAAAIFALHPVHVESVAWVTELKNVLSGFFYLLSLLCYLRFLGIGESSSPAVGTPVGSCSKPWMFYFLAIFLFICALACKTVTATLPAAILLIIWWKTGRVSWTDMLSVLPMFILGIPSGLLSAYLERTIGASGHEWTLPAMGHLLLAGRILWFYAGKLIWPDKLMFIYPRWDVNAAVWWQYLFPLAAAALMATLWSGRKKIGRAPLTGVLFFAGTLMPVLGFLNVYPMRFSYVADHFQYLASLGLIALFAAATTLAIDRFSGAGLKSIVFIYFLVLLPLGVLTYRQSSIYDNADHIWLDTLKKNPACWLAHSNLGFSLASQGKTEDAVTHFREALRLKPDFAEGYYNLGEIFARSGKVEGAITCYHEALRLTPDLAEAHNNLGVALIGKGKTDEAIKHYQEALRLKPKYLEAENNWGLALAEQGKTEEAIVHFRKVLQLSPNLAETHNNLGIALARQGKTTKAIEHYQEALRLKPGFVSAIYNLGIAFAEQGNAAEAIAHYQEALRINPELANAHNGLGTVLAYLGRRDEAIRHFRKALKITPNYQQAQKNLDTLLELNQRGQ